MSYQSGCCQVHHAPLLEGREICQNRWQDHWNVWSALQSPLAPHLSTGHLITKVWFQNQDLSMYSFHVLPVYACFFFPGPPLSSHRIIIFKRFYDFCLNFLSQTIIPLWFILVNWYIHLLWMVKNVFQMKSKKSSVEIRALQLLMLLVDLLLGVL